MPHRFQLAENVHFCEVDGAIVFLNAAKDRYLGLSEAQTEWFRNLIELGDEDSVDQSTLLFANRLCDLELVAMGADASPLRFPPTRPPACSSIPFNGCASAKVSARTWSRFLRAIWGSWLLEKRTNFGGVLDVVREWKANCRSRDDRDLDSVVEKCLHFHFLTPFFFSTRNECRYRSLSLLRFLTLYGIATDWVFGVRSAPFAAHCWIEHNGVVLNDDAENTRQYKTIMSV